MIRVNTPIRLQRLHRLQRILGGCRSPRASHRHTPLAIDEDHTGPDTQIIDAWTASALGEAVRAPHHLRIGHPEQVPHHKCLLVLFESRQKTTINGA